VFTLFQSVTNNRNTTNSNRKKH